MQFPAPFPWIGSKRRIASKLVQLFPKHTCYCEPFAGTGAVFFAREDPADVEVLNDVSLDIVTLFRVIQHHPDELVRQFRWALVSRTLFEWAKETPPETLTDVQRAARFLFIQRLCYGGRSTGQTFGISPTTAPRLNLFRLEEDISALHTRLASVFIENLDWRECIRRYDRAGTLFFVDPPYLGTEGYESPFDVQDHQRLAEVLAGLKGKAMLTINDHPETRTIYGAFRRERISVRRTLQGGGGSLVTELVYRTW